MLNLYFRIIKQPEQSLIRKPIWTWLNFLFIFPLLTDKQNKSIGYFKLI